MSVRRIPGESRRWTGNYLGNYYGTLYKTHNIDLDRNEGHASLSLRMSLFEDSADLIGGSVVNAFTRTDADCTDRYWALNDRRELLKTDSTSPEHRASPIFDWDADALDSTPTQPLDFTVHTNDSRNDSGRNKLFVTTDTGDIAVLNDTGDNAWTGSWWVTKHSQPRMDTNEFFHPIEYFPFRKITLIGDGNRVHTISRPSDTQNDTVTYSRLVLPKQYSIDHFVMTAERAWILMHHKFDGEGAVAEWDGYAQTYNKIHNIHSVGAISGVNWEENPIILNSKGAVMEFTGNGFSPMFRSGQQIGFSTLENLQDAVSTGSNRNFRPFINPRGMVVGEDGLIYLNHSGAGNSYSTDRSDQGGIWCLNPRTGRMYQKYSVSFSDTVDFGHQILSDAGALYWVPTGNYGQQNLVASALYYANTTNQNTGIFITNDPSAQNGDARGYFITQPIPASEVKEFWDKLWIRIRKYKISTNEIVAKAKGTRYLQDGVFQSSLRDTITWTSTTTFTVDLNSNDESLQVGDEVEVRSGPNAGILAHITTISGAHGAVQTITIDETVLVGSGTSHAQFDRWKKLGTITSSDDIVKGLNIGLDTPFIMFKIELRGWATEVEVQELLVTSKPSINLEQ